MRKNLDTSHVVLNCYGTLNPKFHFEILYCFLIWRRAAEKFDCYPKMGKKKKTFLEPAPEGNVFFDFKKAKNKEKLKKLVFYCLDQKQFCPFWREKKVSKF